MTVNTYDKDTGVEVSCTAYREGVFIAAEQYTLRIESPSGTVTTVDGDDLTYDSPRQRYTYIIDADESGLWSYRFTTANPQGAVQKRFFVNLSDADV